MWKKKFKNSATHEFSSSFFYFFFLKNIFIKWRWKEGAKNMKKNPNFAST
jgi:hypothetical protein